MHHQIGQKKKMGSQKFYKRGMNKFRKDVTAKKVERQTRNKVFQSSYTFSLTFTFIKVLSALLPH